MLILYVTKEIDLSKAQWKKMNHLVEPKSLG